MANFYVAGPFEVPVTKGKGGKIIGSQDIKAFWASNSDFAAERGCYIFAFRASKGFKPIYIGKTTKSYKQEAFPSHKLSKYAMGFSEQKRGTAVMFFVCAERNRGRVNAVAIDELESFLIQSGLDANPNLANDRKTEIEAWTVSGLVRSRGKPSSAASALRKCLSL